MSKWTKLFCAAWIAWLIFALSSTLFGQVASIASRRYAEKTPLQFTFGSFTAVAPFNQASGYTTVSTDGQLQPPGLVLDANNFSSTSDFTQFGTGTFSVASNVGSLSVTSSTHVFLQDTKTSYSIAAPSVFVQVEVNQNASFSSGAASFIFAGIVKDDSNAAWVFCSNQASTTCNLRVTVAGTNHSSSAFSFTFPSAPWRLGFSMTSQRESAWYSSGTSGNWNLIGTWDASAFYDFRTPGNLTGFKTACGAATSSTGTQTWKVSNLIGGAFGGVGISDIHLVTYPDGRPYMAGPVAYFTADLRALSGGATWALCTYDTSTGTFSEIAILAAEISSVISTANGAGHIVYNPASGDLWILVSSWGITAPVNFYFASANVSTLNIFSGGSFVITGFSQMTLPFDTSHGWDPSLVCSAWNYSAGTCSGWLLATASYDGTVGHQLPALFSSSSDPSANTWSLVGNETTGFYLYEGSTILRTATGASGVALWPTWGGKTGSSTRATRVYNSALSYQGALNATLPAGTNNAPWPQIFSYGNTEYFLSFNDNLFGTDTFTTGNLIVATAAKY